MSKNWSCVCCFLISLEGLAWASEREKQLDGRGLDSLVSVEGKGLYMYIHRKIRERNRKSVRLTNLVQKSNKEDRFAEVKVAGVFFSCWLRGSIGSGRSVLFLPSLEGATDSIGNSVGVYGFGGGDWDWFWFEWVSSFNGAKKKREQRYWRC